MYALAHDLAAEIPWPPHRLGEGAALQLEQAVALGLVTLFPSGERIGRRFELRELIGVGNASLVYRAVDYAAHQGNVAVKILNPGLDEPSRNRIVAGALTLVNHRHRNVVLTFDAGVHEGHAYIASEYLPRSLSSQAAAIAPEAALRLFHGVAEGLRFLHSRGLVHRDVHARNVLLQEQLGGELRPKLNDVGVGAWLGIEGVSQLRPEFLFHLPPESLEDPSPETTSDVFALGVLLYSLLAGQPPIAAAPALAAVRGRMDRGETLAYAYRALLAEGPHRPLPADLQLADLPDLQRILNRAMRVRPQDRYPSVEAFEDDITRYEQGFSLLGVGEGRARRLWKLFRRHRQRAVQVGVGIGALAVGASALGWQRNQPGAVVPVLAEDIPQLQVEVEGEDVPIDALAQLRLGPGVVQLHLSAPGFAPETRWVDVPPGGRVEVRADLLRKTGDLSMVTTPPGALVTLTGPDNRTLPAMVAPFVFRASTGDWTALIESPDYDRSTIQFAVRADEPTVVQARIRPLLVAKRELGQKPRLTRLPGNPARLAVSSFRDGEPWIDTFDPRSGDRLSGFRLAHSVTSDVAWTDWDNDGTADLLYGDSQPALVLRSGRDLAQELVRFPVASPLVGRPLWSAGSRRIYAAHASGAVSASALSPEVGLSKLWERNPRALGPVEESAHHGPVALVGDTVLVREVDGSLLGARADDGQVRWEMPGVTRAAVAVVGGEGSAQRMACTDREGRFLLVEPAAGKVLRESDNEARDLRGQIPVWEEDGVWRRVRVMENGRLWLEDLENGALAVEMGVFPGVEQVWSASDGPGKRVLLLFGAGTLRGVRVAHGVAEWVFSRPVEGLSAEPVFFWQTDHLGAAWVEGQQLVMWSF